MICPSCQVQQHEQCRYPHSCPCQHVPSENVQIAEVSREESAKEVKPLDMDALTCMFSAVAHLQAS